MKYRKGIGIFLINSKGQLWVGKRVDNKNNYWQMPQGGIDQDESEEDAMRREMYEEVGLENQYKIIAVSGKYFSYDLPRDIVNFVWNGMYKGQTQRWFCCKFLGNDSLIDLNKDEKPEFCNWKWIRPEDCVKEVVPFKKSLYKSVLNEFKNLYD